VLILAAALVVGQQRSRLQDVRNLAAVERARIVARTLDELKTTCAAVGPADQVLREHCRDQATFLILFPECDGPCTSVAAGLLPHAHR
jgi:cytochrome b pre-mRNA-processing protein 3